MDPMTRDTKNSAACTSGRGNCNRTATRRKLVCPECGVTMLHLSNEPAAGKSPDCERDQPPVEKPATAQVRVVNCTPHVITLIGEDGESTTFPPSGMVPRVAVTREPVDGPLPMVRTTYGEVEGLPDPAPDTLYIVSNVVLTALGGSRPDVIAPDTGPHSAVRDEAGQIVGVRNFRV